MNGNIKKSNSIVQKVMYTCLMFMFFFMVSIFNSSKVEAMVVYDGNAHGEASSIQEALDEITKDNGTVEATITLMGSLEECVEIGGFEGIR